MAAPTELHELRAHLQRCLDALENDDLLCCHFLMNEYLAYEDVPGYHHVGVPTFESAATNTEALTNPGRARAKGARRWFHPALRGIRSRPPALRAKRAAQQSGFTSDEVS